MTDIARTVILVPRRGDGGPRDRIWAACRARWQRLFPEVPIFEGQHTDGPFNRASALNAAARAADAAGGWDLAVVIDADVFLDPEQLRAAIARATETGRVTWAFRRWRGIGERATERVMRPDPAYEREVFGLDGWASWTAASLADMDTLVECTNPLSWSCCFVVPRAVWDDLGGFDERFRGWGWEDMAFRCAVRGLHGAERVDGDVYHWWHPRSTEREPVRGEHRPEYEANRVLGRRYMAADDDRGDPTRHEPAEWTDRAALRRLVDEHRFAETGVTLIVHTDGRRECIERTIPSLVARVTGPIVRRVIYDDSGDPSYRAWLTERFGADGFYVVGPAKRLGYTGSMRAMWRYLGRRAPGRYVFMVEDDFLFDRDVDLAPMIEVLRAEPALAQMALLRAAYYPRELEAGGIVEQAPERYQQVRREGASWLEHHEHFTANPCLFPRSLTEVGWPETPSSERVFGDRLIAKGMSFAYWGEGDPWITHIGATRAGTGY